VIADYAIIVTWLVILGLYQLHANEYLITTVFKDNWFKGYMSPRTFWIILVIIPVLTASYAKNTSNEDPCVGYAFFKTGKHAYRLFAALLEVTIIQTLLTHETIACGF
jgi:hypothetical protein